ncbi:MAG TPA: DUF177 domain-containing protein [Hyphomicrobiaceae bacterium]|nr:DUF177 domain-containing protein [Hyphomicrobiaceae bacterium]
MPELEWTESVAEIPSNGLEKKRSATAEECASIAAALGLVSCEGVAARYRITPRAGGRYALDGTIDADVTQECVVTLEPLPAHLTIPLSVEFVPEAGRTDESASDLIDPFATVDVEPIVQGRMEIGRVVVEEVASNLDPYPRRPESAFEWQDEKAAEASPFAALAKLKDRKPES